jgi:hypothetical protein
MKANSVPNIAGSVFFQAFTSATSLKASFDYLRRIRFTISPGNNLVP